MGEACSEENLPVPVGWRGMQRRELCPLWWREACWEESYARYGGREVQGGVHPTIPPGWVRCTNSVIPGYPTMPPWVHYAHPAAHAGAGYMDQLAEVYGDSPPGSERENPMGRSPMFTSGF